MADGATSLTGPDEVRAPERIPMWLLATVLILLVAVLAVAALVATRLAVRASIAKDPEVVRMRILESAAKDRPDDITAHRQLAFAYQQAGRDRDALREYSKVLAIDPEDLAALFNSGEIYIGTGKGAKGEKSLLRVLELAPTHSLAAKSLAEYYAKLGKYDKALAVVVPAAQAHPELADLQCLQGLAYEKTGHASDALACYRRAQTLIPGMPEAREGLARLGVAQ